MIIPAGHSIFPFIPNFSRLFSENDVMIFINAAFLLILFVLAMWIVLKCGETPSEAKMIPALVIYAAVSASILLRFGPSLEAVKGMILGAILLWASLSDLKSLNVPDFVIAALLILSFVGFEPSELPSMILGAIALFVPQCVVSKLCKDRSIGGADIKISSALGFMLGLEKGLFASIAGLSAGIITMFVVRKIKKESGREPFALVPFLSAGAMLAFMI
ncbi:MAG: A24 family peptidase [Clostridiales bacterium]|nr:A24 family peptidase [Clostridiales bacterium]